MNADVVIIGGGAVGTSVTYHLAEKGLQVVLIDRSGLAGGTSGRCDGNVLVSDKMPGYDSRLNKASQDMFPGLAEKIGFDFGWHSRGSLMLMESEQELEMGTEFCARLVEEGIPARMLDKYEVHQDEPTLSPDVAGGMEVACDGSLNPMALVQGLGLAACKLGARVITNNEVKGIRQDADGSVSAVETDQGVVNAPRTVCCAGVWTFNIGRMVNLDIPINPRQGQILVSESTHYVARRKVHEFGYLSAKFESDGYERQVTKEMKEHGVAFVFEPTMVGNFLIGSSRRFTTGEDVSSHMGVLRAMAQRAIRFFPIIKNISVIRSYAGLRPYTPDHMPVISETPVPGFYVAAGHEGDGIGLSLITGKLISEMIAGEETSLEIKPLSLDRFENLRKNSS